MDITKTDAFGNKINEKEGNSSESEQDKADADIIKTNMQNSSKIYYKITHSIEE
jgi:hypothetical protein